MKCTSTTLVALLLLAGAGTGFSQGFINLNFESAVINTSGAPQYEVVASDAIPGWAAYINANPETYIVYNTLSLGAASVDLEGPGSGLPPVQGNYFVYLQPNTGGDPSQSAAIGQTGQISLSALSLTFWGYYDGALTFNGQALNYDVTGSTANYNIYTADISDFSGQTGQLLFTASYSTGGFIDNIKFSPSPAPEPGALSLSALGGLFFAWRRWKHRSP